MIIAIYQCKKYRFSALIPKSIQYILLHSLKENKNAKKPSMVFIYIGEFTY